MLYFSLSEVTLDTESSSKRVGRIKVEFPVSDGLRPSVRSDGEARLAGVALLDEGESEITEQHLPDELLDELPLAAPAVAVPASLAPFAAGVAGGGGGSLDEIERQAILRMLEAEGGNISSAARKLGISRNTLYRKIGRLGQDLAGGRGFKSPAGQLRVVWRFAGRRPSRSSASPFPAISRSRAPAQ